MINIRKRRNRAGHVGATFVHRDHIGAINYKITGYNSTTKVYKIMWEGSTDGATYSEHSVDRNFRRRTWIKK